MPLKDSISAERRTRRRRRSAATKGAGGPIEDAELIFQNVTAAIKATGGSTEDVRGAITAMVQASAKEKLQKNFQASLASVCQEQ